jgi:hypothetical protein
MVDFLLIFLASILKDVASPKSAGVFNLAHTIPSLPARLDNMVFALPPLLDFIRRVNQEVLGNRKPGQPPPESGHLLPTGLTPDKGMVLDNEEIQVRVGPGSSPDLGTEEYQLLGVNLSNNNGRYFFN